MERSVPRRHSEYDRRVDDADGHRVLDRIANRERECIRLGAGGNGMPGCVGHFTGDATAVDDVASGLAALAARSVCEWCPQSGRAAGVVVSNISLVGIRVRRAGGGIRTAKRIYPPA